ncbi:hypothetical protein CR513_48330, partial [Mucuna pruriens]
MTGSEKLSNYLPKTWATPNSLQNKKVTHYGVTNKFFFVHMGHKLTYLPTDLEKMLKGFKEIFSKEIPHGFPTIIGIEQIDFIPKASMTLTNAFELVPRDLIPLEIFYKHFVKDFSILATPLDKIVKNNNNEGHAQWVKLFKEVVRLHGLPKTITQSLLITYGKSFGVILALSYFFQLLVILKWMARLRYPKNLISTSKFAYSRVVNTTKSHSPFELVYEFNLLTPLYLLPLPNISSMLKCDGISKAQFVKILHVKTRDLVWVHLRKERFPNLRKSKLLLRGDGPFKVLAKVNDKAYILDMPQTYKGSHTFHVADLSPYDISNQELEKEPQAMGEHGHQSTPRPYDKG